MFRWRESPVLLSLQPDERAAVGAIAAKQGRGLGNSSTRGLQGESKARRSCATDCFCEGPFAGVRNAKESGLIHRFAEKLKAHR